ncbi:MAG: hypothetical protein QNJ45_11530 [Ardenticatenaceae bacterium]|nr:hypothetical protein [Ardenticatenaceae bacterium]
MKVAVDTSVFSLFLRRNTESVSGNPHVKLFRDLFERDQIALLGVVYQELLSGIRHQSQFDRLNEGLLGFDIILATVDDHFLAAEIFNSCRQSGIQGSSADFLICAMTINRGYSLLTTDQDFEHYAQVINLDLIQPL